MINVLSLYSDKSTLGDYRVRLPAQAVTNKRLETGVHVEASNKLDVSVSNGKILRVGVPGGVKVISFQRPARQGVSEVIAWLRENRPDVAVVVDIDDQLPPLPTDEHLRRSIALADVLTTSTEALAHRYGYDPSRTFVIRNAMPADVLTNPSSALSRKRSKNDLNKDRTIGWAGNALAQAADLAVTKGALASVVGVSRRDGREVTFRSIGPREGLSDALSVPESHLEVSGVPLPTNLHRIALGEIDIGIVPTVNPEAGSTLALEFAAAGVVVIASDTPEHRELAEQGMPITLVGPRKREWTKALKAMLALDDKGLKDLANAHRANVRQYHTADRRAFEWAGAFRTAYQTLKED